MKRHAPATARNREPIAAVLTEELPARGLVLEIASGTGEHAIHFARTWPDLLWQPTDCDAQAVCSVDAWGAENGLENLLPAIVLDAAAKVWPIERADAIVCVNMVHIAPPAAAEGLLAGAGRVLAPGAPLVLYGPFLEDRTETSPSNLAFDASLKQRDVLWGLRRVEWIDELAARQGLVRARRVQMPAHNLTLIYRK